MALLRCKVKQVLPEKINYAACNPLLIFLFLIKKNHHVNTITGRSCYQPGI